MLEHVMYVNKLGERLCQPDCFMLFPSIWFCVDIKGVQQTKKGSVIFLTSA